MRLLLTLLFLFGSLLLLSCNGVQYNKVFLSDEDMALGAKASQKTEISSTSYREGASGANGGSSGGGCGCN